MSRAEGISLADRIRHLQKKNLAALHQSEMSRTTHSEGNKENSVLSSSVSGRQNKTAPAGNMFDLSKVNESLPHIRHNVSHILPDKILGNVSQGDGNLHLAPIRERERNARGDKDRGRMVESENMKQRSKSAGTKCESRSPVLSVQVTHHQTSGLRPSISTSSLNNQRMVINNRSYIWLNVLGKGGSSRVYEVYDEMSSQVCALKVVDLGDDESARRSYLNEIELLSSLQGSPYVIKMHDYELRENENTLYVVMEKGDTDLSTFLKTQRTDIDSAFIKYHWNEMLRCVKVIHDRKIVHSDLKPANFLLVKGNLKLIDFGIAAPIPSDMTAVVKDSQMGTLSYMSPEVLSGDAGDGKYKIPLKADVWSLGCILYNLVYGHLPFNIKSQSAKMAAIMNPTYAIEFPERECLDPLLLDVMKRCLVRDVRKRADVYDLLEHPYLSGRVSPNQEMIDHPNIDYLALAKEMQNNTPNTMAKRLEALTKGSQAIRMEVDDKDCTKKTLHFE